MNWLMGHLVGDYCLQNDWMAANKKHRFWPLLVHGLIYTLTLWLFTHWPWPFLLLIMSTHVLIDGTQVVRRVMHFNGQEQFMAPPCGPWSVIVVDNIWHLLILYAIAAWLERSWSYAVVFYL